MITGPGKPTVSATLARRLDAWSLIPRSEFAERQNRARRAAQDAGLAGLVIYSRGVDGYGDVLYLANHHSQWPFPAEHIGLGTGRTHSVLVLPVDGPSILISDVPWWRGDLVVADDVRAVDDVSDAVVAALGDSKLTGKRLGLVGMPFMTAAAYVRLVELAGGTRLERRDDFIERLRIHKSDAERAVVRASLAIADEAMTILMDGVVAGATESEVVAPAVEHLERSGAVLLDAACASGPVSHEYTWARLPSRDPVRELARGDLFHVDFYGSYGGYYWDFSRTRVVGDDPMPDQAILIDAVSGVVDHVCSQIKPGVTAQTLYEAGRDWLADHAALRRLERQGAVAGLTYFGHGLGVGWEGPWLKADEEAAIEEGDVVSVEHFLARKDIGGVMLEQNGIVTPNGFEQLTRCRHAWQR